MIDMLSEVEYCDKINTVVINNYQNENRFFLWNLYLPKTEMDSSNRSNRILYVVCSTSLICEDLSNAELLGRRKDIETPKQVTKLPSKVQRYPMQSTLWIYLLR